MHAQAELGRDLARRGEDVELHGTVVNGGAGRVLAAYAAVGGLACVLGLLRPVHALVVLAAVVLAAGLDLEHGRSWLRLLVPRDIARTVVVWRARGGAQAGQPPGVPSRNPAARVLVCLPADAARPQSLSRWGTIPLAAALMLASLGCGFRVLGTDGGSMLGLALAGFVGLFVAGLCADRFARGSHQTTSGADLLHAVLETLRAHPLLHLDVCCAVVGGGSPFFDGASVLLLNHENRLPRHQTTVLSWAPARGPLMWVSREGVLRTRMLPPALLELGAALGLPPTRGRSTAGRARVLGWPALGLQGGSEDLPSVHLRLVAALRHLDEAAGSR